MSKFRLIFVAEVVPNIVVNNLYIFLCDTVLLLLHTYYFLESIALDFICNYFMTL